VNWFVVFSKVLLLGFPLAWLEQVLLAHVMQGLQVLQVLQVLALLVLAFQCEGLLKPVPLLLEPLGPLGLLGPLGPRGLQQAVHTRVQARRMGQEWWCTLLLCIQSNTQLRWLGRWMGTLRGPESHRL